MRSRTRVPQTWSQTQIRGQRRLCLGWVLQIAPCALCLSQLWQMTGVVGLQFIQETFPDHGVLGEEGGIMGGSLSIYAILHMI